MKTYNQFKEAAALAIPAAMKVAPYVIPALGAGANILKGMMQSDASDRFKARQRPGRTSSVSDRQREQARQDRRAEAQRRARENTPKRKEVEPTIQSPNKPAREKVDPRLERAANQVIDSLRRGNTLSITNRETGLSDSEKRRVGELMDIIKRKKQREKTQQTEKDILDYGRKKKGIKEQTTRLVNVRTVGGITRGIDPSTGAIRIIKGRTKKEQEAVKNPPGFEMY